MGPVVDAQALTLAATANLQVAPGLDVFRAVWIAWLTDPSGGVDAPNGVWAAMLGTASIDAGANGPEMIDQVIAWSDAQTPLQVLAMSQAAATVAVDMVAEGLNVTPPMKLDTIVSKRGP